MTEGDESGIIGGASVILKMLERAMQQTSFPGDHALECHPVLRESGKGTSYRCRKPAVFDEDIDAEQHVVSGKCGEEIVRAFSITHRPQRKNLPDPLARSSKPIGKTKRFGTEIADAESGRQRSDVQQNAARSLPLHFSIVREFAWRWHYLSLETCVRPYCLSQY